MAHARRRALLAGASGLVAAAVAAPVAALGPADRGFLRPLEGQQQSTISRRRTGERL